MTRPHLNVRNNNPLNIRFNPANDWDGQTGENGGFAVFKTPEYGFRAAYKLITRYINQYGLTTLDKVVHRWAPPDDDNHTQAYIDYLAAKLDKFTWTPIFDSEIPALIYYMAEFEGAQGKFTFDQVKQGIALA